MDDWEQMLYLLICFGIVAVFAGCRIIAYFDVTGGGKVVTAFYFLIFLSSSLRVVWLYSELASNANSSIGLLFYYGDTHMGNQTELPARFDEEESFHLPEPSYAFATPGWRHIVVSEALHSLGTLSIFSVFLLVAVHWLHMLRKIDREASATAPTAPIATARNGTKTPRGTGAVTVGRGGQSVTPVRGPVTAGGRALTPVRGPGGAGGRVVTPVRPAFPDPVPPAPTHPGPFATFVAFMLALVGAAALNILLYVRGVYSSEGLVLFDNVYLALTSLALLLALHDFSARIRAALRTIGVMSERPTEAQGGRILYITIAAYLFFLTRAVLELASLVGIVHCWIRHEPLSDVVIRPAVRQMYVGLFYWPEVLVLLLAVAIASADQAPPRRVTRVARGTQGGGPDTVTPLRGPTRPRYDGTNGLPLSEMPVGSCVRTPVPGGGAPAFTPYRSPVRNDKHVTYSHAKREYKRISTDANTRVSLGMDE